MVKQIMPNVEIVMLGDDPDKRTYSVNFKKIKTVLGFKPSHTVLGGIKEIKGALDNGVVKPDDLRTKTVKYYQYLLDADKVLSEIKYDGKVF
jgi:hypothetical protein